MLNVSDMPLFHCSDVPSLPVLRFGIGSCGSNCGGLWQLAVQLSTGLFQGYMVQQVVEMLFEELVSLLFGFDSCSAPGPSGPSPHQTCHLILLLEKKRCEEVCVGGEILGIFRG